MKKVVFITLGLLVSALQTRAQPTYGAGILPQFNLTVKTNSAWSFAGKLESRQQFFSDAGREGFVSSYEYLITDVALLANYKYTATSTLAGGYLFRVEEGQPMHRVIQQLTVVDGWGAVRIAHRFSTDQTYEGNNNWEFRARYRFLSEFALSGRQVDTREWYMKLGNEHLLKTDGMYGAWETRFLAIPGYVFNDNNKFEAGLDARLELENAQSIFNDFWVVIGYYYTIE